MRVVGNLVFTFVEPRDAADTMTVDAWSFDGTHVEGPLEWPALNPDLLAINLGGTSAGYPTRDAVAVRSIDGGNLGSERVIGRHHAPVVKVAASASGARVASSEASGNVRIWDAFGSGSPLREVYAEIPSGLGHALGLDSGGTRLATTAKSAIAHVWDLETPRGVLPLPLRAQREFTWRVQFSADGRWVSALSRVLTLWPLSDVYPRVLQSASAAMPNSLAFDPLGRWLAVASTEGVRLWPMPGRPGESVSVMQGVSDLCCSIVFTVAGDRLLVGDAGTVRVVPLGGGAPRELPMPDGAFFGFVNVAVSPDGRFAAAGSGGSEPGRQAIPVWDLATERLVATLRPPRDGPPDTTMYHDNVIGIAFTPDGRLVTSGQAGVRVWVVAKGEGTLLYRQNGDWPMSVSIPGPGSIAFVRGYRLGADEGVVWWCDIADCQWKELASTARTSVLARDRHGNTVVTSMLDGTLRVGSLADGEPHLLYGHAGAVMALAVSPDGRWIASGDTAGLIRLWRMPDRSRVPFQSLPREQILAKLRSFTNLRAVKDPSSPTGYAIKVGENIGWREVPEW
jgi:WD40 repeat protein